jgi:hypothetical protein
VSGGTRTRTSSTSTPGRCATGRSTAATLRICFYSTAADCISRARGVRDCGAATRPATPARARRPILLLRAPSDARKDSAGRCELAYVTSRRPRNQRHQGAQVERCFINS